MHILLVGKSLLWKVQATLFLVLKIFIQAPSEPKSEEAWPTHLFLNSSWAPRPGRALFPGAPRPHPAPGANTSPHGESRIRGQQADLPSFLISPGTTQPWLEGQFELLPPGWPVRETISSLSLSLLICKKGNDHSVQGDEWELA